MGCAGVKQQSAAGAGATTGSAGSSGGGLTGGGGSSTVVVPQACDGLCTDFPTAPVVAVGVPDISGMFGSPSGNGPCVTEPEDGALFPNNWLRPRVRAPGATYLKVTMHADKEANDLVGYASGDSWTMPPDIWKLLASHIVEQDISVTVQVPHGGATTIKFQIAAVGAAGSMVFWSADPSQAGKTTDTMPQAAVVNDSYLEGFTVGTDMVVPTLKITDVQQQAGTQGGTTQVSHCIGCHAGTPDGDYVSFVDAWPWSSAFAGVKMGIIGNPLPGFPGGVCTGWNACTTPRSFVQYPWSGPMAFSAAHWATGDKKAIVSTQMRTITMPWSTDNWQPGRLAWIDLESTATTTTNGQVNPTEGAAFGYLARTGDPHPAAAFPTWSHDGNTIVYASTACSSPGTQNQCGTQDGRLYKGQTDLYEIPYAAGAGGPALPVVGASTTEAEEYYPAFSPDDRLLAFTRVPMGEEMYANPDAELYVVPYQAGTQSTLKATKLNANNPPLCSGKVSPGINNHWPKWSPDAVTVGSKRYYWIIFSSNRYGVPPVTTNFNGATKIVQVSQLYITAVVTDELSIHTYPAIYLWNQDSTRLNTTPAWEHFHIPIVIN